MSKHTVKGFVHYERSYSGQIKYSIFPFEMTSCGYILVGEQEFEVDVPDDFDPMAAEVAMLRKEREKVRAELGRRLMEIDEQIAKRLSIEFVPADSVEDFA